MGYGAPGMLLVAARFDQDLPEHPTASGVVAHEPAQARIEEMYLHEDGQWRRLDVPTGLTAWTKQPADWAQQISDRMSGGDHWPQGVTAENIGDALRARHPDLDLSVYASAGGYLVLQMIRTPRALRGQGKARAAMADLVAVADHLGMRIGLTAEPPAGERTSITRLRQFYRSFGFVPNTGRGRDPEIWEAMRRDPR